MITIRSALFNLVFFGVSALLTLVATPVRIVAPGHVMGIARLWARVLVAASRVICGIHLDVKGMEHLPTGAVLIASRHQSAFDTFVWLTLLPRCCYVFKTELLSIPLFGSLIKATGMIGVDRRAGGAAIRSLLRQADIAARDQRQIVIFPEGTRSEPGSPGVLQSGIAALATHTGLPVIPVSTDSGKCWGRRAFRKQPGTIKILIGPKIDQTLQRNLLIQALANGMAAVDHSIRSEPGGIE